MKRWMRTESKLFLVLVLVMSFFSYQSNANAATVGSALTQPEEGWMRIDDNDVNATYSSNWGITKYVRSGYTLYNGSAHFTTKTGAYLKFNFYGTKIRIIDVLHENRSASNSITIDGVTEIYSAKSMPEVNQAIVYQKDNLELGYHSVIITNNANGYMQIDAIDIDSDGKFINIKDPMNLIAHAGNEQVALTWSPVENASAYNVKIGTESGVYNKTVVATKDDYGNFVIPGLTNGTKYYFVVNAIVNGLSSDYSNEASATPIGPEPTITPISSASPWPTSTVAPEPTVTPTVEPTATPEPSGKPTPTPGQQTGDRAILVVTMNTGLEKEFDLSMEEINAFLNWYDARDAGNGPAKFAIDRHNNNKGPFTTRKEYVIFDKILTFSVDEYSTK
ncbi:fibronectin type III domain-containing protein [Paenibacillus sp. sgz5001063]|uniref:fibronectin type III domain-containing protein n=1 Tax=Paenibacillus sp. sgz5001063 TaxID=3242474 RepID=UPI0036D35581